MSPHIEGQTIGNASEMSMRFLAQNGVAAVLFISPALAGNSARGDCNLIALGIENRIHAINAPLVDAVRDRTEIRNSPQYKKFMETAKNGEQLPDNLRTRWRHDDDIENDANAKLHNTQKVVSEFLVICADDAEWATLDRMNKVLQALRDYTK
jgi:hypothetical protein